jgi:hypothetical protein
MTTTRLALLLALGACGEAPPARSGVDPSIAIADLTPPDVQIYCEWSVAERGGFGSSEMCDDGTTIETESIGSCVDTIADLTCTDTIGALEDCILATGGNLCLLPDEPACAAYEACVPRV